MSTFCILGKHGQVAKGTHNSMESRGWVQDWSVGRFSTFYLFSFLQHVPLFSKIKLKILPNNIWILLVIVIIIVTLLISISIFLDVLIGLKPMVYCAAKLIMTWWRSFFYYTFYTLSPLLGINLLLISFRIIESCKCIYMSIYMCYKYDTNMTVLLLLLFILLLL